MTAAAPGAASVDRTFTSVFSRAAGLVVSRQVVRDPTTQVLQQASLAIMPDAEYERHDTSVPAGSMSEAEKELAICCSDRELKEELSSLRSRCPEVRQAALHRLQTHSVFDRVGSAAATSAPDATLEAPAPSGRREGRDKAKGGRRRPPEASPR